MTEPRRIVIAAPVDITAANAIIVHLAAVADGLRQRGADVEIVVPRLPPEAPSLKVLNELDLPVHFAPAPPSNGLLRMLRPVFMLPLLAGMAMSRPKPAFYIRFTVLTFILHAVLRGLGARTVSEHNGWMADEITQVGGSAPYRFAAAAAQVLDAFTAGSIRVVAPSLMHRLSRHGISIDKVFIAENGTDMEKFKPGVAAAAAERIGFKSGRRRIGILANLTRWQGAHYAVAAMDQIRRERDDIDLVIAGGGLELENLQRQAAAGKAADNIIFLGQVPVERANDFLNALDIALAPFPGDRPPGSPVKLRDYCAAGCAIVASDLPQNLEQLPSDVAQFHKADDPGDLARTVLDLLADPGAAADLGRRARTHAEKQWAWEITVDAIAQYLHKLKRP